MVLFWVLYLGVFRSAQIAPVGILARHYGTLFGRNSKKPDFIEPEWKKRRKNHSLFPNDKVKKKEDNDKKEVVMSMELED